MTDADYMNVMQHDDGSLSAADLIAAYERGGDELRAAVAGMTADDARARPVPGTWSTVELVCHLAGTELYLVDRVERALALDRPLLVGVDQRPYAERLDYQAFDLAEEVALFAALRRHLGRVLRGQPAAAWARPAVHTQTGLVTVRQLVFQPTRHLRHHLPFLAAKRAALAGS